MNGISFGIKTNLKNEYKTLLTIHSILSQYVWFPFEILVTGNCNFRYLSSSALNFVTFVPDLEAADTGKLGRMMNHLAGRAQYNTVVLMDDDIILCNGWFESLYAYISEHPDYDILAFPLKNTDGSRFWDWALVDPVSDYSRLLPIDCQTDQNYVTGGMVCFRKNVWLHLPWNHELAFYKREDVEWTQRAHSLNYKINFCSNSFVYHNDGRYFQVGDRVVRSPENTDMIQRTAWPELLDQQILKNIQHSQKVYETLTNPFPEFKFMKQDQETNPKPTILWMGHFKYETLTGSAACGYVHALRDSGADVIAFDLDLKGIIGPAKKDITTSLHYDSHGNIILSKDRRKHHFICVIQSSPDFASQIQIKGAHTVLCMTSHDLNLTSSWINLAHKFDDIWVSNHIYKESLTSLGISEHKIFELGPTLTQLKPSQKNSSKNKNHIRFLAVFNDFKEDSILLILTAFLKAFRHRQDVSFILKSRQNQRNEGCNWKDIYLEKITSTGEFSRDDLPEIKFIDVHFTEEKMSDLFHHANCIISTETEAENDPIYIQAKNQHINVIGFTKQKTSIQSEQDYLIPLKKCKNTNISKTICMRDWNECSDQKMFLALKNMSLPINTYLKSTKKPTQNNNFKEIFEQIQLRINYFKMIPQNQCQISSMDFKKSNPKLIYQKKSSHLSLHLDEYFKNLNENECAKTQELEEKLTNLKNKLTYKVISKIIKKSNDLMRPIKITRQRFFYFFQAISNNTTSHKES